MSNFTPSGSIGRPLSFDLPVGRHDHRDVVPGPLQLDRQRAAHIGQPPRFGKRGHFAAGEDDVQGRRLRRCSARRNMRQIESL